MYVVLKIPAKIHILSCTVYENVPIIDIAIIISSHITRLKKRGKKRRKKESRMLQGSRLLRSVAAKVSLPSSPSDTATPEAIA